MSGILSEKYSMDGNAQCIVEGDKRTLHIEGTLIYDIIGDISDGGEVYVNCNLCGKKLLVSNGTLCNAFHHKCSR